MPGTLFVVATPIGNLEDITFRALRTLREVNLIAAEDTRRTAKLLAHYDIHTPMVSLHAHNEFREAPKLVARLLAGDSIAIVSDAGTPGIADPGARVVRAAREAGMTPIPIPGPSAVTAALSISGIENSSFVFMGFPPPKGSDRARWIARLQLERRPVVFFEAPHRVEATVAEIAVVSVKRQIDIFREITKIHFELVIQPHNVTQNGGHDVGEFVVVVHGTDVDELPTGKGIDVSSLMGYLTNNCGLSAAAAEVVASDITGIKEDDVGLAARRQNKLAKQQKMKGR